MESERGGVLLQRPETNEEKKKEERKKEDWEKSATFVKRCFFSAIA